MRKKNLILNANNCRKLMETSGRQLTSTAGKSRQLPYLVLVKIDQILSN